MNPKLRTIASDLKLRFARGIAFLGRAFTINDVFMYAGIGATSRGISMIYEPAAWIFAGLTFLVFGWWGIYVRTRH